jgi:hypothetical protein
VSIARERVNWEVHFRLHDDFHENRSVFEFDRGFGECELGDDFPSPGIEFLTPPFEKSISCF